MRATNVPDNAQPVETPLGIPRRWRVAAALLVGLAALVVVANMYAHLDPSRRPDVMQQWIAARALARGDDPYAAVLEAGWPYPYYYPIMAAVAMLPLAVLTLPLASIIFVALGVACLAYALTARGWWPLLWLVSGPVIIAAGAGQWAPLLAAAIVMTGLRGLYVVKPNIGLALAVAYPPPRSALVVAALLTAGGFILDPGWIGRWLAAIHQSTHFLPIVLRPGGVLLLLALLRWRRPEARYLAALACIPHTVTMYEAVPLAFLPRNRREMLFLVACTQAALFLQPPTMPRQLARWEAGFWPVLLVLVYLPALILLLRAPNRPAPEL